MHNAEGSTDMVKVFATTGPGMPCGDFVASLGAHPDVDLVGVGSDGRDAVDAIRSAEIDALLFGEEYADLARTIRLSLGILLNGSPAMVLAAEEVSKGIIVRSIACGFDGLVAISDPTVTAADRLVNIVNGMQRLWDEPLLGEINYTPGLLARTLVSGSPLDAEVLDLVGAGLDDDAIARLLGIGIQDVRNRIEGLMHVNGLTSRTHLAVARASHVVIPDFA